MDFTVTQITNGGFTFVCLVGVVWFLKWLLVGEDSGVNRFMESWQKLGNSSEKISTSVESMNDFMRETLTRQGESLDMNAINMERQERAGRAFCDYLRHEISTRSISDESKQQLQIKINEIEEGLTK